MSKLPRHSIINRDLSERLGIEVVKWHVMPLVGAGRVRLAFVSVSSDWRQGVRLGSSGLLKVGDVVNPSFELWYDTAPAVTDIFTDASAADLHIYNIWDRGRGKESQSFTSGMVVEKSGSVLVYRCNDIGTSPDFSRLVFSVELC